MERLQAYDYIISDLLPQLKLIVSTILFGITIKQQYLQQT